jgi:dTMP kinase
MGRVAQALGATDPLGSAVEFTVDRWLARPRLEALLRRRDVVVSDRSFYSTLAYQGSALPPPTRKSVARLQVAATVPPDQVLLLELPVSAALCRVRERGALLAPLERERTLRRVRAAYRAFARREGWTVLDARSAPKDLADRAERAVVARLPRRGRGRG